MMIYKLYIYIKFYTYFNFFFLLMTIPTLKKNTVTEPILISISQDVSIISVTEITDEVNRCYQPTVDKKYEEGGE